MTPVIPKSEPLKSSLVAALEAPRPEPAKPAPHEAARGQYLAERAAIREYVIEHRCTEQEAKLALSIRAKAKELLPAQMSRLAATEAKAAHALEAVEGEREKLESVTAQWDKHVASRAKLVKDIGALRDHVAMFRQMVDSATHSGAIDMILGNELSVPVLLQHLAGLAGAERGLAITTSALPQKESALVALEVEMREFGKANNIPGEFWP